MKKKFFWIIAYPLALILCVTVIYIFPTIAGMLESTYIVEHGSIEVFDETEAYVVRNETVFTAAEACEAKRVAKEDKLVRVGASIVKLSEGGKEEASNTYSTITETLGKSAVPCADGLSTKAGYISYSVDGAEAKLCYDNLAKIKKETLDKYSAAKSTKTVKGSCAKGEPLFKVVANGDWWLVFYLDNDAAKKYNEGSSVKLTIGDETVSAYVDSKTKKGDETRIVLCCSVFVKDYLTMRKANIKVTTSGADGLIIQNKSIVEKDGHKGVLIKNKYGRNVFRRIRILADDGTKSAVEEDIFMDEKWNYVVTIGAYDEILTSPSEKDVENAE